MVEKALGKNYFEKGKLPIHVARVNRALGESHEHDLTEIPHYHDFTEIIIILRGSSLHFVEGNEYLVSAGDIFVLQGYQSHSFKDASNIEIVNVMFDTKSIPKLLDTANIKKIPGYNALFILEPQYRNNHHFRNILHLNRKELAKIEIIINSIFIEQNSMELAYETIIKNKLEELIIYLSREYSKLKSREALSLLRIATVIEFLENNFNENINLENLAVMSNMSVRNFQRIFKKATGQSPIDYLIHIRIQKSKILLSESNLQVADIALQAGFNEYNYFSRKFKKSIGISPLKYRIKFRPIEELNID
jgi:AraC-like DNA-binding protein